MPRRTALLKILTILLGMAVVYCFFFLMDTRIVEKNKLTGGQMNHEEKSKGRLFQEHHEKITLFHLDLKGAPPKMAYILEILPLIRKAGANGILIEYEDMFPWSGTLQNISAKNAYNKAQVKMLLKSADDLGMEVIPLIQTFGHLEFVLKLPEFRHLRELDSFPQEVCPSKPDSMKLIKEMIRQVMEVHKKARYIHIGCDEVYHLAACPVCSRKPSSRAVFTSHVKRTANFVRTSYNATPIIWDDMLRKWPPGDIEESGLGQYVEPMVWVYIEDIRRLVPNLTWWIYRKSFNKVWGASAFKGAFGEREVLPNLYRHAKNNLAWQRLMSPHHPEHAIMGPDHFRGLVITGWSRYDHFAVLAELLPVALPSLILSLTLAKNYVQSDDSKTASQRAIRDMLHYLKCPTPYPFNTLDDLMPNKLHWVLGRCQYPGSRLYHLVNEFSFLTQRMESVVQQKNSNGWVSQYNLQHTFSSPYRIMELFPDEGFAAQRLLNDVEKLRNAIQEGFSPFYDNSTTIEWIEQKINPLLNGLVEIRRAFQVLLEARTWPRKPIASTQIIASKS